MGYSNKLFEPPTIPASRYGDKIAIDTITLKPG